MNHTQYGHSVPVRSAFHAPEPGGKTWHFDATRKPRMSWRRKLANLLMTAFCAYALGLLSLYATQLFNQ